MLTLACTTEKVAGINKEYSEWSIASKISGKTQQLLILSLENEMFHFYLNNSSPDKFLGHL